MTKRPTRPDPRSRLRAPTLVVIGLTLLIPSMLLDAQSSPSASGWMPECHSPGRTPNGHPYNFGELITKAGHPLQGGCEFSYVQIQGQPAPTTTAAPVPKARLDQIIQDLDRAQAELASLGLGQPDVNKCTVASDCQGNFGKRKVIVYSGTTFCVAYKCSADEVGNYQAAFKTMRVSGTGPAAEVRKTSYHELFHSIEKSHALYSTDAECEDEKNKWDGCWWSEGIAEGFAWHLEAKNGNSVSGYPDVDFEVPLHKPKTVDDAYHAPAEFWFFARNKVGKGSFVFIKKILEQQWTDATNLKAIHLGFRKKLGVRKGLRGLYADFVAEYLNSVRKDDLKEKTQVDVRNRKSGHTTTRKVTFSNVLPLATKGRMIVISAKKGQLVEVKATVDKQSRNKYGLIAMEAETDRRALLETYSSCDPSPEFKVPLRAVHTSIPGVEEDKAKITLKVKLEVTVVENDVCTCSAATLVSADLRKKVRAEEKRSEQPVHTYVELSSGGQTWTFIDKTQKSFRAHHTVEIGKRQSTRDGDEDFERTYLSVALDGLQGKRFGLDFPLESPGQVECRLRTKEEKKDYNRSSQLIPEVDFCGMHFVSLFTPKAKFDAEKGIVEISQWKQDCWIEGSFNMEDRYGAMVKGTFAIDAGHSGMKDRRTGQTIRGPRFFVPKKRNNTPQY